MKNNFNLRTFLTENKLTTSSKILSERNDIVATKELKASDAFRDAGIDMSKPVLVVKQDDGHGEPVKQGEVPAEKALSMFKALRAQALESGREDHYEFDNELNLNIEGYEYKLSYFEEESTTTVLMQKATVSEIDADLLKRAQNTPAPKDAADKLAKRKASPHSFDRGTLQVSMGSNAEQEQRVIDIARDAIGLMSEQPGTSAEDALAAVLDI